MNVKELLTGSPAVNRKADAKRVEAALAKVRQGANRDGASADTVNVSSEARLGAEAYRAALAAPEVRQDKVDEVRARLDSGEYTIDTHKIAEKLVKSDLGHII